jgi:xylan 1,4-beta-xylosidase
MAKPKRSFIPISTSVLFLISLSVLILILILLCSCIVLNEPVEPSKPVTEVETEAVPTDITLSIGAETGMVLRPLLGVNIGPVPAGSDPNNADLTTDYNEVGVNLIRTHDYYGALDMSVMYPDRTLDPANPASYDFTASDKIWKAIIDGGFEPYFRLGDSYNNSTPPANPAERHNWVKAAVEVIRHYRQGKWNGFNTPFRYVEIWNEPDNQQFWPRPHTPLEYFLLYGEAATVIKHEFSGIMVGGPGITPAGALTDRGQKWTQDFLDFAREKSAPLDFFSWHMYSNDPAQYVQAAKFYRSLLDARGFAQAELHITEWNTDIKHGSESNAESRALRTGSKGAAILTAAWIGLQKNGIDVSTFYRGPDPDIKAPTFYGMFYADGKPKHIALAFSLWSKMTQYPGELAINNSTNALPWVLAGQDTSGKMAILIANTEDKSMTAGIEFADGSEAGKMSLYRVSDSSNSVEEGNLDNPVLEIKSNTVQLLVIE